MKNFSHAVTHIGRRRERKVNHPELDTQSFCHFPADEFSDARHFVSCPFDEFRNHSQIKVRVGFESAVNSFFYDSGTADAHINDRVRFADSQIRACHKGDILGNIGKYAEFGAGESVFVRGQGSSLFDDFSHEKYGIHVDTCTGGRDIHGSTDAVCFCKGLGNCLDQCAVAFGNSFFNQCAESADEINIHFPGNIIEGFCRFNHKGRRKRRGCHSNRTDRNAFVDHWNAVFVADPIADCDKISGKSCNSGADIFFEDIRIMACTIQKTDSQCHGTDIEMLILKHFKGGKNFSVGQHGVPLCFQGNKYNYFLYERSQKA